MGPHARDSRREETAFPSAQSGARTGGNPAPGRQWRILLQGLLMAAAIGVFLTAERGITGSASASWWRALLLEMRAVVTDPRMQWVVVVSLWVYVVSCWWWSELRARAWKATGSRWGWRWLVGMLAWSGISYGIGYGRADEARQYVGLLATVVAGWWLALWMTGGDSEERPRRSLFGFGVLAGWLAVLSWIRVPSNARFRYWSVERWGGFWGHPNEAGLLMALGTVLAVGLLWCWWANKGRESDSLEDTSKGLTGRMLQGCVVGWGVVAGGSCLWACARSYSRGAWLSALCGLGYLLWHVCGHGRWKRLRQAGAWAGLAAAALLVTGYWELRHIEVPWLRRIYSIANIWDFSWRNRILGWEGALQMMADRPLLGWGWQSTTVLHGSLYSFAAPAEVGAIALNSWLVLGAGSGVVALMAAGLGVWFLWRAGRGLRAGEDAGGRNGDPEERLVITARAGALVMGLGCALSGGLFSLKTGTWLWLCLLFAGLATRPTASPGSRGSIRAGPGCLLLAGVAVGFAGSLLWAMRGDPFSKSIVLIRAAGGQKEAVCVMRPRFAAPAGPLVIYLHGVEQSWRSWGQRLVQVAGTGVTVAGLSVAGKDLPVLADKLRAVREYLLERHGSRETPVVWVGFRDGAASMFGALSRDDRLRDDAWVWVEDGPQPRLGWYLQRLGDRDNRVRLGPGVWIYPLRPQEKLPTGVEQTLAQLGKLGVQVERIAIPWVPEASKSWEAIVFRLVGEEAWRLAGRETARGSSRGAEECRVGRGSVVLWLLPGVVCTAAGLVWRWRERREGREPARTMTHADRQDASREGAFLRVVRMVAGVLVGCALVWSAFQVGLRRWSADARTVSWVRSLCVQERHREDFEWLLTHGHWEGKRWSVWLEHIELAEYNRRLVAWKIPDEIYRSWVLNPWLAAGASGDVRWRWALWERLYPRMDDVESVRSAAALVAYYLRSRVSVLREDSAEHDGEVLEYLRAGRCPEAAFHRLCVAALRSVGIPARLGAAGEAEFWDGQGWHPVGAWLPVRCATR